MDVQDIKMVREIAQEQQDYSKKYAEIRNKASISKTALELILVKRLKEVRISKPNIGIEMAYLMLMEMDSNARELYTIWKESEAEYKGLEKMIEAYASRLMLEMHLNKWQQVGERTGNG